MSDIIVHYCRCPTYPHSRWKFDSEDPPNFIAIMLLWCMNMPSTYVVLVKVELVLLTFWLTAIVLLYLWMIILKKCLMCRTSAQEFYAFSIGLLSLFLRYGDLMMSIWNLPFQAGDYINGWQTHIFLPHLCWIRNLKNVFLALNRWNFVGEEPSHWVN